MMEDSVLTEDQVSYVCALHSSVEFINLSQTPLAPNIFDTIPEDLIRRFKVVPVVDQGNFLVVAVSDPMNFETLDTLPILLGREISPVCATPSAIEKLIRENYGTDEEDIENSASGLSWGGDIEDELSANDAPIVKLVSHILVEAFKMRASDIHIEPLEASLRIRYRVDGKLMEASSSRWSNSNPNFR